jgi:hypothetical protein
MKRKIADSVILSSTNLLTIVFIYGIAYASGFVRDSREILPLLEMTLCFVVLPAMFLVALIYAIRDLIRPWSRIQALVALALTIPTVIFLRSMKLDL